MKVLVFTDLHYYGGTQAYCISKKKLVQFAEPMLDEFKRISKEEKVDFVINLGDIIQDTNNKELDLDCLKYIFGRLQEFSCPVYSVLGNHDLKMMDSIEKYKTSDPKLYEKLDSRIRKERLTVRYLYLRFYMDYLSYEKATEWVNDFEVVCAMHGIDKWREISGANLPALLGEWRLAISKK